MELTQPTPRAHAPRKLAAWTAGNPMVMVSVRELTAEDERQHEALLPHYVEARNRLMLFAILKTNFAEWRAYVAKLKTSEDAFPGVENELNRLILNYLTCAYTIWEHNKVSVKRRFRKMPQQLKDYDDLLEKLTTENWAFAFVADFRGYVQHVALAVGAYSRNVGDKGAELTVTVDPKELVRDGDWQKSQLQADRGPIDLIAVLEEFHRVMIQDYWHGAAKTFLVGLVNAHIFYAALAAEVEQKKPGAKMVFLDEPEEHEPIEGRKRATLTWSEPPSDVFKELGMTVRIQKVATPPPSPTRKT